jgi:hypothetical protein
MDVARQSRSYRLFLDGSTPDTRADTGPRRKTLGEVALIGESADQRDLRERHLSSAQERLGKRNTLLHHPLVRRHTDTFPKGLAEPRCRQSAFIRDIGQRNVARQIG